MMEEEGTRQAFPKFHTLKPNLKKIFLKNMFNVLIAIVLIAFSLAFIHFFVGLDVFLVPYEALGLSISPIKILSNLLLAVIALVAFSIVSNFLLEQHTRYDFYFNKLVSHKSRLLILTKLKEIPYHNIVKVSYNQDGIFNKLFRSGTVIVEISGMKFPQLKMEFMDHSEHVARYIHHLLYHYKTYMHHYHMHHHAHRHIRR
jgi:hypothetical protein